MVDIKINYNSLKRTIQPVIEKAGIEYTQSLVNKLFTSEEKRQLVIKIVSGHVEVIGPQELLDRLKKEVGKR
jgi:hypothetical protein